MIPQVAQQTCPVCESALTLHIARPVSVYAKESQYDVYRCEDCGCGVTVPTPTTDQFASHYARVYDYDAHTLIVSEKKWRARHIIDFVKNEPFDSLLDVGCMYGYLLEEAQRLGISRVEGVELSEKPATWARQQGLSIFQGTIEQYAATKPNAFDLIIAQHVFEHILDFDTFLDTVFSLLRPGGRLVMCVPHFGSRSQKWFRRSWGWYQLPTHLFHYSPFALRMVCERHGFEILQIKFRGGDSLFILLTLLYSLKSGTVSSSGITPFQKRMISLASLVFRPYYYFGDEEILATMRRPEGA